MRNVFTAQTPAEAQLVAGLLDEAGIECVVEGEFLTGARMELPMDASTLPSVHVRDEDAERALAVVERHARNAAASPPSLPDDEMPERRSLWWFKQFLLVVVILIVTAWIAAAAADPMIRWILLAVVGVFGIVWLLMRRPPRRL